VVYNLNTTTPKLQLGGCVGSYTLYLGWVSPPLWNIDTSYFTNSGAIERAKTLF